MPRVPPRAARQTSLKAQQTVKSFHRRWYVTRLKSAGGVQAYVRRYDTRRVAPHSRAPTGTAVPSRGRGSRQREREQRQEARRQLPPQYSEAETGTVAQDRQRGGKE